MFRFLITNFQVFLIVYAAVLLDTVGGIRSAIFHRKFDWKFLPAFIDKLVKYTGYLMFGNLVDHFSSLTGYDFDGVGLYLVAATLIAAESASVRKSIKTLTNQNKL